MMERSIAFGPTEVAAYYANRAPDLVQRGHEWRGACPVHQGRNLSFAVQAETGLACCHSKCGRGWDILALEMALTGCDFATAKASVFAIVGKWDDSAPGHQQAGRASNTSAKNGGSVPRRPRGVPDYAEHIDTYRYTDERGELLYEILRWEWMADGKREKSFGQRHLDGRGRWINRKAERQVLYHLREVLENAIIFLCEGEKDCETLRSHGFVATTIAGGASAPWLQSFTETLRGREVIVIPDNDKPGRAHAAKVARALFGNVARLVILELEGEGVKDATDWFAAGHSELELIHLLDGEAVKP